MKSASFHVGVDEVGDVRVDVSHETLACENGGGKSGKDSIRPSCRRSQPQQEPLQQHLDRQRTVAANIEGRNFNVPSNDGCKCTWAGEFDVCASNLSSPSGAWSEKLTSSGEFVVRVTTVKAPLVLFSKVETKERSADSNLRQG